MAKPNVILIVLDTVRAKNMSCYGYERSTTPFLEEFASQCAFFQFAFSPAIWTIPSHASMFTGTHPAKHGALNLHRHLDTTYVTLAAFLSSIGYETLAYTNNHFLSLPQFGLSRGFNYIKGPQQDRNRVQQALHKGRRLLTGTRDCGATVTNQFVDNWLRDRKQPDKPFLLFLNYMDAHAPYTRIPRNFASRFLTRDQRKRLSRIDQDRQKYLTRSISLRDDEFFLLRSAYDAQICYLDSKINSLVSILKNHKVFDNSIIIITSDHGDMVGEHELVHHSYCVYEELIRIPLMLRLPGNATGPKRFSHLVSLVDLFPTVCEVLEQGNQVNSEQFQGQSLFWDGAHNSRKYIFAECERPKNEFTKSYPEFDFSGYDRQLLAIRSKDFKFIWSSDDCHELYDLRKDPDEQSNLVESLPDVASTMRADLLNWYNSFQKHEPTEREDFELDGKVREQLQALGYF